MSAQTFLDEVFHQEVYLQVSSVDLCVDVVRHISFQKIKNGRSNLQKIAEEANREALFTSRFEAGIA